MMQRYILFLKHTAKYGQKMNNTPNNYVLLATKGSNVHQSVAIIVMYKVVASTIAITPSD